MSGIPAGAGSLLGKRLGKFEILALLALGGTAEIYLARIGGAAGFEKYVVVKCLHDHLADDIEFVKMFLDEARLAAHLDHSNIVQTTELGEHENRYYMVMEFLAGLSLAMVVRRAGERLPGGRLPAPLVLNIIAQGAAGLHYAHEKVMNGVALNIVHRDISPQNLVVSFEGVVKVVDFGIAKAELRETQTRSGTIKGKFAYMSPEQCVAANVDRRTDIFALGVIAHELLTGKRLFKKPSAYETYQAVIECQVVPPSKVNHELDPTIDAIVMKALAKEKENRYQTAEAFGDALLGYLHHRGKSSGPNDVARFFDTTFAQEIEEHGARMRELIAGREASGEMGGSSKRDAGGRGGSPASSGSDAGWDDGVDLDSKSNMTVDLSGGGGAARPNERFGATDERVPVERYSAASLSDVVDDLGGEAGLGRAPSKTADLGDDDDDDAGHDDDDENQPAERTRIEANPLDLLKDLEPAQRPSSSTPALPRLAPPTSASASGSLPQLPTVVAHAPTASAPMATRPTPAPIKIPSIANPGPPPAAAPPHTGPLRLPDVPSVVVRPSLVQGMPRIASGKFPDSANLATMIVGGADDNADTNDGARAFSGGPGAAGAPAPGRTPTPSPRPLPVGQLPPEQSPTQIAAPLDPARLAVQDLSGVPRPTASPMAQTGLDFQHVSAGGPLGPMARPSVPSLPNGYPVMDAQMSAEMASGAAVFPSATAGSPARQSVSPGAAPTSGPYQVTARGPDSGSLPFDPGRAVDLASPVGSRYSEQDWATVAALPARAIPTWMLALIFIGALGAAMIIVIVLAKLVR